MLTKLFVGLLVLVGIAVFAYEFTRNHSSGENMASQSGFGDVSAEDLLHSGVWTSKGYESAGNWRIIREATQTFVELDANFSTQRAPDLKIFLSPRELSELNGDNATEGAFLVSPLTSNSGAQRYEIAGEKQLSEYRSIIIHCQQFSKLWSGAPLE